MNRAIEILTSNKTDTELLGALVHALVADDESSLKDWAKYTNKYETNTGANIEVVREICTVVLKRSKTITIGENHES